MLIDMRERLAEQMTTFSQSIGRFKLTIGRSNAYPERSVSYFYIAALRAALGGGQVLLEVPASDSARARADNHFDALAFNDDAAILAEFKRAWSPSHLDLMAKDVERVRQFAPGVKSRFLDGRTRKYFGFYGLDCWRSGVAQAWATGEAWKKWRLPESFFSMRRESLEVWRQPPDGAEMATDFDGYYLMWAIEELP